MSMAYQQTREMERYCRYTLGELCQLKAKISNCPLMNDTESTTNETSAFNDMIFLIPIGGIEIQGSFKLA